MAKKLRNRSKRNVTLDPRYEYEGYIVTTFPDFAEILYQVQHDTEFSIVCRFRSQADIDFSMQLLCDLENFTLFVEEAEVYFDARSMDENFNHLVNFGRHQEISLVGITQRSPQLNIKFRAQYSSLFSFNQTEPADLKRLRDYGFDEEEIHDLAKYHYKVIGKDIEEITLA